MTNIQVEDLTEIKKKVTFEVPQEKVLDMMDAEVQGFEEKRPDQGISQGKGSA